ncbi:MAG: hypothetical protein Q8P12_04735 [bacterium]|nr:hypothetical protein [bacterium]
MSCARGTIVRPHPEHAGAFQFVRPDCKMLSCPHCGPKRAAAIRNAILKLALAHKLTRFMTLTLDPKKLPPNCETVAFIRESWRKFRVYLTREFHRPIKYISVLEFQKNGRAHLHILVDRFIEEEWIRTRWQAVGGGQIVDIRLVDIHQIALYLAKYLTKDFFNTCPPGKRRVSVCRALILFPRRTPSGWRWFPTSFWFYFEQCREIALEVELDAQGESFFVAEFCPGDEQPFPDFPP